MSFNTALSGLNAAQADLSVTSNDIANVNTVGFKESRAEFGDIFATSSLGVAQQQLVVVCYLVKLDSYLIKVILISHQTAWIWLLVVTAFSCYHQASHRKSKCLVVRVHLVLMMTAMWSTRPDNS